MKRYLIILAVFLLIDAAWLGLVAPSFYQEHIGHLMAEKVNFLPALMFYLIYVLALLVFIVNPALADGNLLKGILLGAFLGFAMYATYDLTNMATLKDWPTIVTVVDLAWGAFVTAVSSGIAIKIISVLGL
ncbi:MAG: DUF2177 family protein [Anaerococcus sp.]